RKRIQQSVPAADEIRYLLQLRRARGGLVAAIHPTAEKRHVRQVQPAQRIECAADDQPEEVCAEEAEAEREQTESSVVGASNKLAAIVGCLLVHCQALAV